MRKITLILTVLVLLTQCKTVPLTGRKQLNFMKNKTLFPMAFAQYDQVLTEGKVQKTSEDAEMIKRVGKRIQGAVEQYLTDQGAAAMLEGYDWEFTLIEDDQLNAWCMPGGKVAFYTGILPVCKDEAGVAVVMGHEVAHAIASHGGERMSQGLMQQFGTVALDVVTASNPTKTNQILQQAVGIGSPLGMLAFSRKHESEADEMGLIFSSMAGYNPQVAPEFWGRMLEMSGGQQPPEFMSTHPHPASRISELQEQMPVAMQYYENSVYRK